MRGISYSNRFKKDLKLCQKQGKDMNKLKAIVDILLSEKPIPARYRPPAKGRI